MITYNVNELFPTPIIEIFDTSATVAVDTSTCENCEMGPTNSTTACCNNYDNK